MCKINKYRKVKTFDLPHWRALSDTWGEPTTMLFELMRDEEPLKIGDKVTFDLRVLIERKT